MPDATRLADAGRLGPIARRQARAEGGQKKKKKLTGSSCTRRATICRRASSSRPVRRSRRWSKPTDSPSTRPPRQRTTILVKKMVGVTGPRRWQWHHAGCPCSAKRWRLRDEAHLLLVDPLDLLDLVHPGTQRGCDEASKFYFSFFSFFFP